MGDSLSHLDDLLSLSTLLRQNALRSDVTALVPILKQR